jgi:hypothetical protein
MAKSVEKSLPPHLEKRRGIKLTFGTKSVVTGEEYLDPNEADWQKYYQKQADKEKAS